MSNVTSKPEQSTTSEAALLTQLFNLGTSGAGFAIAKNSDGSFSNVATGSGSGTGITWNSITGTTQTASSNNGYVLNNAGLVTLTLPSTAAVGDVIEVVGKGTGLWKIAQVAGQTIHFGNTDTTTGVAGSLAATLRYDSLRLVCITANTDFVVVSSVGSITIV